MDRKQAREETFDCVHYIYIFLNHVNKTKPRKEKKKKGNIRSKKMLTESGPLIWREKNA